MPAAEPLVSLRKCTGSPGPSLLFFLESAKKRMHLLSISGIQL